MTTTAHRRFGAILAGGLSLALIATGVSLTAIPAAAAPEPAGVTLTELEVENRTEPLGIDVPAPRFSWITESSERDVQQSSYRLRVSTRTPGTALADSLVWDSGVVTSDASTAIEYGGPALAAATDYSWSVEAVTTAGDAAAESRFTTGFLEDADWAGAAWIGRDRPAPGDQLAFTGASWIWTPEPGAPYAPAEPRAFRTVAAAPGGRTAKSVEIVITADDSYELFVNGQSVARTEGNENEWQGSKRYIVPIGAGEGDRAVFAARTTNGPNSPAGLLLAARITFDDDTTTTITSDASWKAVKTIPAGFEAAGFDDSSWPAAAIQAAYGSGPWGNGVNPPSSTPAAAPLIRKQFEVTGQLSSAKLTVGAGGYADVSLNGAPINDEILSPGYTDYDDHAQYTVTDVTAQLQPGSNALGMVLGRGFYGMTNGNVWNWQNAPWHDEPTARAVLRLSYIDGSTEDIVTDDSWMLDDSATLLDDLYGGETYDARREQPGFDTVGFDDGSWTQVAVVSGPKGEPVNQQQQPIRVTERLVASSVTEPAPGAYLVTFPRVLAGNVEITAQGDAGSTIRAQYGEKLLANGRPNFSNNGGFQNGFQTDRFILAGTGAPETWAARFSYKGFQYLEVTGWPVGSTPTPADFVAELLHTDAAETGSFESSNDIMNRTHRAVVDTLLNNLHGIPTDTPMFEKNGWTGDAAVGAEMFLMNLDTQNLFEKWIGDINDTRDADGAPLVIAPSSGDWGAWGVAPPWHSAFILIPWWLYQYGGDTQVLAKYYDSMKTYVDLEFSRSPGGVVPDNRLGDWVSPEASPAGGNAPEDSRVSGTAYLYTMLTSMEKTATLLGRSADAASFTANAAVVKDGFNTAFLDTAAGLYRGAGDVGYRQTHNALALAFGLAPDDAMAERVAASLAADVTAKGDKLNTGSLGSKYLLPVLTDYGYADLAYRVAVQTAYPSWGFMIENGATSMWEHWALEARSRGHYFLGTVDDWFYHDVAGINSSELTGYRDITIAPKVTAELDWAKATTQTPFGPVSVDWKRSGATLSLQAHVPIGSTAVVQVPAANRWAVTEGGKPLAGVDGVREVSQADGQVFVTVGSGDYAFLVDDAAGAVGAVLDRLDELQAQADAQFGASAITVEQHGGLSALVATTREHAAAALVLAADGESLAAAETLADTLADVGAIDANLAALAGAGVGEAAVAALVAAADAVRTALDETIASLLGITGTATLDASAYQPGATGTVTAALTAGTSNLGAVTGRLAGLDVAWQTSPEAVLLADGVDAAATVSGPLEFTVPADALPSEAAATAQLSYVFNGAAVGLAVPVTIAVDSAVLLEGLTLDPSTVAPGASSTLTAVVRNTGVSPVVGHLAVTVPDGWTAPLPGAELVIAPGAAATLTTPVFVPSGAAQAAAQFAIGAEFRSAEVALATGSAQLTVALAAVPEPNTGYDHIDLGEATSEQAHALTASSSSGTSGEAGYSRRYAGHLTDYSYFEFDQAVVTGEPFVIRAVETYDKPQTKRYKVYVDGTEVALRQFTHTGGAGIETYEIIVDGALAIDGSVRVRFENQADHSYYDPSIADVWTLPLAADTTAPQLVLHADPPTPDAATGWYRGSPVTVTATSLDDRDGDGSEPVVVEASIDGGDWEAFGTSRAFRDDGVHELRARATDATGNVSVVQTLVVQIDTAAPETVATLGDGFADGVAQGHGTVDLTASDGTSGVASTSFRVNGGDWQSGSSVVIDEAGDFTVEAFSIDVAGNIGEATSISGTVEIPDVTAPIVDSSVSNPGDNGWALAGAALTITATDDDSGVASIEVRIGSGDWAGYIDPVVLPEGTTTVQLRATDVAGNTSPVQQQQVRVDGTAPTVWGWLSDTGRLAVVATDGAANDVATAGSGIARVQYSLDGESWADALTELVRAEPAPASVLVRAVDRAGNTGETVRLERSAAAPALTVAAGDRLLVEASGFAPGQLVRVELHSEPLLLATVTADGSGVIATIADVPTDFASGQHRLVLAPVVDGGADPGAGGIDIPVGVIAATGADPLPLIAFALVLLLGGGLLLGARRRRQLVSVAQ